MTDFSGTSPQPSSNRNRNIIIGVVVGVLLCCCCLLALGVVGWACGDWLLGAASGCSF